jgi:hypothetical protein
MITTCACSMPVFVFSGSGTFEEDPQTNLKGIVFRQISETMRVGVTITSPHHRLRVEPVPYILTFGTETVTGMIEGPGGVSCNLH